MTSQSPSHHGYRFPPEIISHAVWLYHRFCLSFRDAEDLRARPRTESLPGGPTSATVGSPPAAAEGSVPGVGCGNARLLNERGRSTSRGNYALTSST